MPPFMLFAYSLAPGLADRAISETEAIDAALQDPAPAWLHMRADDPDATAWLKEHLDYLDPGIPAALAAVETRPRAREVENGILLILRGVNTNPGQAPEDMVSIRLWLDPSRIVSMSIRPLKAVEDLAAEIEAGLAPVRTGEFLCALIENIGDRIEAALGELDAETDALEDIGGEGRAKDVGGRISVARRGAVLFRRHIASQRDALAALLRSDLDWIERSDRSRLAEAHDLAIRVVEELDAIRERLQVLKDDLNGAQNERLNRNLYFLSIISVVFLPLGFLTGLLGVNLDGIPGASSPAAFWTFTGLLVSVFVVQVALLRTLRLI